jgi:hypothetical protein
VIGLFLFSDRFTVYMLRRLSVTLKKPTQFTHPPYGQALKSGCI